MSDAVFPFPGGKSKLASWVLDHVSEHRCFVEAFGGAAGILANKDPDTSKVSSRALSFSNKTERLREFAERFDDVVLENLHWRDLVEKYDDVETVLYFDPPYVGAEDYYPASGIDHEKFVDELSRLDAHWLCSYQELPEGAEEFEVLERDEKNYINSGTSGSANRTREHLLLNFEPEVTE